LEGEFLKIDRGIQKPYVHLRKGGLIGFELNGVNSDLWNFTIVAWSWINNTKIHYHKSLITQEKFTVIELNIKELLDKGREVLQDIKLNDLK